MAWCVVSSFFPRPRFLRWICCGTAFCLILMFNGFSLFGTRRVVVDDNLANITHHIAFVKTHKAASSTVLNILYRFARDRDLVVLLPKSGNYIHGTYLNKTSLMPPPSGKTYDILCNHAIFNHTSFSTFLPSDTAYIGIVREPFERFLSAFYYFRFEQGTEYLRRVPGNYYSILTTFLNDLLRWEPKNPMASMTNNRMVIDFGFPGDHFHNEFLFDEYLLKLNNTLRVVIVAELFDESLVLMRRAFNWTFQDIVYTVKNKARFKPRRPLISEAMKRSHQNISQLDYKLYRFFLKRLYRQMELEGEQFQDEVKYFKAVREAVGRFCKHPGRKMEIRVAASNWTVAFPVTRVDCTYLQMEEPDFVIHVRRQQMMAIRREGSNNKFMNSLP